MLESEGRIAPRFFGRLLLPGAARSLALLKDAFNVGGLALGHVRFLSLRDLPALHEGCCWSTIVLNAHGKTIELRGLSKPAAAEFCAGAVAAVRAFLDTVLERGRPALEQLGRDFEHSAGYLRHVWLEARLPGLMIHSELLESPLLRDRALEAGLLTDPEAARTHKNEEYLACELERYEDFFDTVESKPLTPMQRRACVIDEGANLVLAGAGSGKTSVIIGRAGYLLESGRARPEEILILAYGRKASRETQERIVRRLPGRNGIVAKTFNALGLSIIGHATGRKPSLSKLAEDEQALGRYLLAQLKKLANLMAEYAAKVLRFLAEYLRPYLAPESFDTKESYVRHLKAVDTRTLRGERVKSQEEVHIANFLTRKGVKYEYEEPYKIDTATATRAHYKPDFFLPEHDIYIEHFCIDERGRTPPFVPQEKYTADIKWKRDLHRQHRTKLIETYTYQFRNRRVFFEELERKLADHGVKFRPLSLHQVLALGADQAKAADQPKDIDRLTRLLGTFLGLAKSSGKDMADIHRAARVAKDARALAFLEIFEPLLDPYARDLLTKNEVDFNDMINEATKYIADGCYRSPYRYILVDEFQDISLARTNLLQALQRSRPGASVFCVGDDWQSIYRFSGADITLMRRFDQLFDHAQTVALDLNFRSNDRICSFASAFVTRNETQSKKDVRAAVTASGPAVTLVQHEGRGNGAAIEHCLKLIDCSAASGSTVYFIGRYGFSRPADFNNYGRRYPNLKLFYDTAHGCKGKEADYVVVLDVNDERYGFPSQIADDPLMRMVLPDEELYPHAEERRLFYVAVSRARHHTYILSDIGAPSVFVKEMLAGRGKGYEFERVETAAGREERKSTATCPGRCGGRIGPRSWPCGKPFYGCSNYPYCKERARQCRNCCRGPMIRTGGQYECPNDACKHKERACPRCPDGWLVERVGPYGPFLGCSNYGRIGCTGKAP